MLDFRFICSNSAPRPLISSGVVAVVVQCPSGGRFDANNNFKRHLLFVIIRSRKHFTSIGSSSGDALRMRVNRTPEDFTSSLFQRQKQHFACWYSTYRKLLLNEMWSSGLGISWVNSAMRWWDCDVKRRWHRQTLVHSFPADVLHKFMCVALVRVISH